MSEFVVITGATGGIGQCVARQVSVLGYVPVIGHRVHRAIEARLIADTCGGLPIVMDMLNLESIGASVDCLVQDGRSVAGVVLAASPPPLLAPFGKITVADHTLFWNTNVVGPHCLLAALIRQFFRPRKSGAAVAVLSESMGCVTSGIAARSAMSGMGAYTISKFGLQGLMAQLEAEFAWLTVSCVVPGFTETAMLKAFDERFLDLLRAQQKFSCPEDIATEIVSRLGLKSLIAPS